MSALGRSFPNAPFADAKQALDYLNKVHWNLKITGQDGKYDLWAGDGELHLFTSPSEENVWAFVLGMGLTFFMVGPEDLPGFGPSTPGSAPGSK